MSQMETEGTQDFKILSIDGGGIKGLFSARVLSEIEGSCGSLAEHFDMLCGTSTGGLIALSLAAGRPASEIVEFYREWEPRIFPTGKLGRKFRDLKFYVAGGKFGDENLKQAASYILGEKRMCDSNSYLCIPTVNLTTASPWVFKTDHDASLTRDSNIPMVDVALATSAAPFYFPVAVSSSVPGGYYVDGGLWANNPALVGLLEAMRFFVGEGKRYNRVRILSVPSASPNAGRSAGGRRKLSLLTSAKEISTVAFETQQKSAENFIRMLAAPLKDMFDYVRISPPNISVEHSGILGLDIATPEALDTLMSLGQTVGQEWKSKPQVVSFFEDLAPKPVFRC
jgi:hypothetical protein